MTPPAPKATMAWPGYHLAVTNHGRWVDPGIEPNPDWRYVDSLGHGHFYRPTTTPDNVDRPGPYPTLEWIVEPCTMGHDDDCQSEGHWECRECRETISPKTREAAPVWIPGAEEYELTVDLPSERIVYLFGRSQWDTVQSAIRAAVLDTLTDAVVVSRTIGMSR